MLDNLDLPNYGHIFNAQGTHTECTSKNVKNSVCVVAACICMQVDKMQVCHKT